MLEIVGPRPAAVEGERDPARATRRFDAARLRSDRSLVRGNGRCGKCHHVEPAALDGADQVRNRCSATGPERRPAGFPQAELGQGQPQRMVVTLRAREEAHGTALSGRQPVRHVREGPRDAFGRDVLVQHRNVSARPALAELRDGGTELVANEVPSPEAAACFEKSGSKLVGSAVDEQLNPARSRFFDGGSAVGAQKALERRTVEATVSARGFHAIEHSLVGPALDARRADPGEASSFGGAEEKLHDS